MPSRSFNIRLSAFNAVLFLGTGVQTPFLPLWLQSKALSVHQIGIVIAVMMGVRVIAMPVGTFLADRFGDRRRVIQIATIGAFLSFCLLSQMTGFLPILFGATLAAAMFGPVGPLAEVFAIEGSQHHGVDYGRIRLWASLSFLGGNLVGGALLDVIDVWWVIYLVIAAQAIAAGGAYLLPHDPAQRAADSPPVRVKEVMAVALSSSFLIFLAAAAIGQSSHGLFYALGSVHWDHLGYSKFTMGALWAAGVLTEVTFFAFSGFLVGKIDPAKLILIGVSFGLLRWMIYALDPPLWLLYPASMLHFASFGVTHFGTMHYLQQNAPPGMRNTLQGIFSALASGILMSSVMWASGPLLEAFGGGAYFFMAVVSAVAVLLAVILTRINPKDRVAQAA